MDWTTERIKRLRKILAITYAKEDEARRVVADVKMDATQIGFSTQSITTWFDILRRAAMETGRLDAIYQYALEDNPANEELKLVAAAMLPAEQEGPAVSDWKGPTKSSGLEKIIGQQSTLVSVNYLELGLIRSRSVARVCLEDASSGTGFLITADTLITNNHVLPTHEAARGAVAQFNYQATIDGRDAPMEAYKLLPEELFVTNKDDDWTAVRVAGKPGGKWGHLEVKMQPAKVGDHVNIIQHAGGGPKQVSFNANVVAYVDDTRIQYLTDTLPGSSGSPVFDLKWDLVGLHHSGGWIYEPASPQKTAYYRNEGIPIARVIKGLPQ